MASPSHFAPLEDVLRDWLPQVAVKSDELLEASWPRLVNGPFSEWLALRQLNFGWRCCSQFAGRESRFLFWTSRSSAREMLDARLELSLRPCPFDEPPPAAADLQNAWVTFPPRMRRTGGPPESTAVRQLILDLGAGGTLVCWNTDDSDVKGRFIQARWIRGNSVRALGPKGAWPLGLLLSLVRALAVPDTSEPGEKGAYSTLDPRLEIWALADSALRLAGGLHGLLEPEQRPSVRPELAPLRSRWTIGSLSIRAGALVNPSAELAQPDEDDTFLAPFRVAWEPAAEGPRLNVQLELPDVVARGELRSALLAAFQDQDLARTLSRQLNKALPGANVTPEQFQQWCVPENPQAQVVRINRKPSVDEYMLVLTRSIAGVPAAVLSLSRETRLRLVQGRLEAELDELEEIFVGRQADVDLQWGKGSEFLVRMLAILVRWRRLLP